MKLISMGNQEYEKKVTQQFIDIIPEHISVLQNYFDAGAFDLARKEVHRMVTSFYIMGLNLKLKHEIDALVNHNLNRIEFAAYMEVIIQTCKQAKMEAEALLLTFP